MVLSTQDLSQLPDVHRLKALSQSLALLDAMLCPDRLYRYYSFNAHWSSGEALASMRNGQGDQYFCLFNRVGAVLKGFWHEAPMSPFRVNPPRLWPGVLDDVPVQFSKIRVEPAFAVEETTFCIWRTYQDFAWHCGNIQFPKTVVTDGSAELLLLLDGNPQTYQHWAENYYERPVELEPITYIYEQKPVTDSIVRTLNPDLSLQDLRPDMDEISYPADA